MLREMQAAFRTGVLGGDKEAALGFMAAGGLTPERRLGIYQNNALGSLAAVLAAAFPVTERLVGTRFFGAVARQFAAAHPPEQPQLLAYGALFPAFLAGLKAAAGLPYLGDVARLEWARHEAYFAADAAGPDLAALQALPPAAYPSLVFTLHPAVRIVASPHPIQTIWDANQPENDPVPAVDLKAGGQVVLIHRPASAVIHRLLDPGAAALLQHLALSQTLGEAAAATLAVAPGFDLQGVIADHLAAGTFTKVETTPAAGENET